MKTNTQGTPGFPVAPVLATGIGALAGIGCLAADWAAPGVLACLAGMGGGLALWMREIAGRDRAWQGRMTEVTQAAQAQVSQVQSAAPDLGRLQGEWMSSIEAQLSAVRNQMESAVSDLGHTFGQMRERLQDAGRSASEAAEVLGSSGAGVAGQVQGQLDQMLDGINSSLSEKTAMFDEVRGFASATDELARMASSVEELAAKTNLLALNAAIEAARAGEEGRGFSIVADEVRKLSMLSAETGQQIRQRVADISAAARRAGEGADRMQGSDSRLLDQAHTTISEVVQTFGQATEPLGESARRIGEQTGEIARDVDQAEGVLGFQADVAATLAAIDDSLRTLRGQLASGGSIDVNALLRPLSEKRFVAPAARPASSAPRAAPVASSKPRAAAAAPAGNGGGNSNLDITFF